MTVVAWIICIAIMVALLAISISLSKLVHRLKVMLNDERRIRSRCEEELREKESTNWHDKQELELYRGKFVEVGRKLRMTQEELARRRSGSR